jgi:hypothetical protein
MLSMNIAFSCFPMLFGSLYLLCHKLGTKGGEKKALKKTLLSQPFSGLVSLDKMAFKKNKIHFRGFFFSKRPYMLRQSRWHNSMAASMPTY